MRFVYMLQMCFLCFSGASSLDQDVCSRIEQRLAVWEGESPTDLHSLPADYVRFMLSSTNSTVDEHLLSEEINRIKSDNLMKNNIEHYFSKLFSASSSTRKKNVAIALSGQVRTMLEPDVLIAYTNIISQLEHSGYHVHVFAYLELTPGKLYRRHFQDPKVTGPFIPTYVISEETVLRGIKSMGGSSHHLVVHESRESADLIPDVASECPRHTFSERSITSQAHQFLKVSAVFKMMESYEKEHKMEFDIIFRVRPDMCMESIDRFLFFSLNHSNYHTTNHPPLFAFIIKDAVALLPRWAAEAYSSAWRNLIRGCPIDTKWDAFRVKEVCDVEPRHYCLHGGDVLTHLVGLGVTALDLHKFWVRSPNLNNASIVEPHQPAIRRPHGCMAFN